MQTSRTVRPTLGAALLGILLVCGAARADDESFVTYTSMSPELAMKAAEGARKACREAGFQAAVAVVDRFGILQVLIRDRFAGPHTPETARRKAWSAVTFKGSTLELADISAAGKPQAAMRQIPNALPLGGGLPIEKAGTLVGAIGVSGAPGGEADDRCARAGIAAIEEDLAF